MRGKFEGGIQRGDAEEAGARERSALSAWGRSMLRPCTAALARSSGAEQQVDEGFKVVDVDILVEVVICLPRANRQGSGVRAGERGGVSA